MKKIVLITLMTMFAVLANAQSSAVSKYFDKYIKDPGFMHLNFSGKMFQMIAQLESGDAEQDKLMRESLGKINSVQVLLKESNIDGRKMYKEALDLIDGKGFEELMSLRQEDKDIRFMIKENNNKINELFMIMGADEQFGLLSITGDGIDLNGLYKLSKKMGMKGFKELELLEGVEGKS